MEEKVAIRAILWSQGYRFPIHFLHFTGRGRPSRRLGRMRVR